MWSRKRLDLGWDDLLAAAARTVVSPDRDSLTAEIEYQWSPAGDAIACLSVRSAFDLLLASLELPRGSEVLVSAVTIGGMLRIIEAHGLVAVPVDVDALTMSPRADALARGLSPRTRAVLVAHLFGGRIEMRPFTDFARRHELLLIEDAAQAYAGPAYTGHPAADVSLFSFGPIKTATALGGGLARVRDRRIVARMREIHSGWPVQSRSEFLARVIKYASLKTASSRPIYAALVRACRLAGCDHDRFVNGSVRGFAERDFFARIRQRPSAPLLSLLNRRLKQFDDRRIVRRALRAEQIMVGRRGTAFFPGSACEPHTHWLLPMWSTDPRRLIQLLASEGFDATQGQSLVVVPPPDGRPELDPVVARRVLNGIIFLPCYPEMNCQAVARIARVVAREYKNESRPGLVMNPADTPVRIRSIDVSSDSVRGLCLDRY